MTVLYRMKNRYRRWLSSGFLPPLFCSLILLLLPLGITFSRIHQEQTAAALAPQVLRFHILANSNSSEDQELKLEVRSCLLDSIYQGLTDSAALSRKHTAASCPDFSKEELMSYVLEHKKELESAAEEYMEHRGFPYSARIQLERCYFPTRSYDGLTFPSGTYDAVRVLLGQGDGRNWWCVLYPPLCFSGALSRTELADTSEQQLKQLIPAEDYAWMTSRRTVTFGEASPSETEVSIKVRLRITELLHNLR